MRTNSQLGVAVAGALVALALLLGAGAAQSFTVQFTGENATGILNLEVGDTFYNITFRHEAAQDIYGTTPVFDFTTSLGAGAAMDAVNAALNSEPDVMSVCNASIFCTNWSSVIFSGIHVLHVAGDFRSRSMARSPRVVNG